MTEKINNAKLAQEQHDEQVRIKKQAESSKIESLEGKTKTVTIRKGTDQEYTLELQFPGVERASTLIEDSRNPFGQPNLPELLKESLKDVVIAPHIESLKWWNQHEGLYEAANAVLNFLTEKL
ncbi:MULTISPECIES: hypothetical protein [Lactobacillus]|uniref:hypothetical protein n=1 Tax=Lactobacillus TaxID=1578 RepID=UPI000BEEC003|nr:MULTISPECIES: hypothetical protein [Lactobacillus]PEG90754.1 hypothetical protein CP363_05070 [Lactobacillus sp. UMNPBX12]PEG92702.1 hypothetical protein CP362_05460 [Lactobacillus sp. UMNPBX11]